MTHLQDEASLAHGVGMGMGGGDAAGPAASPPGSRGALDEARQRSDDTLEIRERRRIRP